jgi:hypothetical protein
MPFFSSGGISSTIVTFCATSNSRAASGVNSRRNSESVRAHATRPPYTTASPAGRAKQYVSRPSARSCFRSRWLGRSVRINCSPSPSPFGSSLSATISVFRSLSSSLAALRITNCERTAVTAWSSIPWTADSRLKDNPCWALRPGVLVGERSNELIPLGQRVDVLPRGSVSGIGAFRATPFRRTPHHKHS